MAAVAVPIYHFLGKFFSAQKFIDFDFEQDFATSKLLVAISKYNLKLSTFSDIFEQWHAGKMGL